MRFTNLNILLCARTSLHAKSTAAKIGLDLIEAAGLANLLAPEESTPQAFLRSLTARLPAKFGDLPEVEREAIQRRLAFAAQRGWHFEEFGQLLSAMMRDSGPMADFRGLLRRFDDCPRHHRYETIARGTEAIEAPYLALMGNLTPADLKPFARKNAVLWGDGFLARFAIISPPPDALQSYARFPEGERVLPDAMVNALTRWHRRLGIPQVDIQECLKEDGTPTGEFAATITPPPLNCCTLAPGVADAFYAYHDGLTELVQASEHHDLDGSYTRFAEKALRIAMLVASLENDGLIELRHWAYAQQIAEQWRRDLHALIDTLNETTESKDADIERRIVELLCKGTPLTAREIGQFCHIASEEARRVVESLVMQGEVIGIPTPKTTRYTISQPAPPAQPIITPVYVPPAASVAPSSSTATNATPLHCYTSAPPPATPPPIRHKPNLSTPGGQAELRRRQAEEEAAELARQAEAESALALEDDE